MVCVGLVGAQRPALSWDEVTTADVARRSVGDIWRLLHQIDAVFGPYYLFMHAWTRLAGATELDLRLPSIVAMAAAVAATGELGRRLFSPLIGLVAGLILCVIPNTSRYAAEARPYAFTCLLSVLAVLLLLNVLARGRAWRWAAYGGVVVLLGLSHLIALTTLAGHAAMVLSDRRQRGSSRNLVVWATTLAAAALVLAPIMWVAAHHRDVQLAWVNPLTPRGVRRGVGAIAGSVTTAWLLTGLALCARRRPGQRVVHLAVLALAPLALVAAASVLVAPFWVARYLLVVLAPTAILAAVAVTRPVEVRLRQTLATRPGGRGGLRHVARGCLAPVMCLAAVLTVLAFAALPAHRKVRGATAKNGPDYRSIARLINCHQRPGDAIVYEARNRAMRAGTQYYLRRYHNSPRDVLQRRSAAKAGQLRADEYPDAATYVSGLDRVWLVVTGPQSDPIAGQPALRPLLTTRYQRIGSWNPKRAVVTLYRRHSGGVVSSRSGSRPRAVPSAPPTTDCG
jgi:mannosyltransferase